MNNGLKSKDFKAFNELLIKANNEQIKAMQQSIEAQITLREIANNGR